MPKIMQAEKIHTIVVMRVLAMLMIILFHSFCFYTHRWWRLGGVFIPLWDKTAKLLNAIDLPMFVFISGFLFGYLYNKSKYHKLWPFIQNKARRLLIPYLFWGIFLVVAMPSLHKKSNLFMGISHLWFLLMLFEIFVIIIPFAQFLCHNVTERKAVVVVIGSYFLFVVYHMFSNHHAFLCIYTTLSYLPIFLVGLFFARFKIHSRLSTGLVTVLFLISLVLLVLYCYVIDSLPFIANDIILRILGYTIVFTFYSLLYNISFKEKFYVAMTYFDRLSMGIYIFSQICIDVLFLIPNSVAFFNLHYYIGPTVIFAVGFLIPWLLSYIFNSNKYTKWLIG